MEKPYKQFAESNEISDDEKPGRVKSAIKYILSIEQRKFVLLIVFLALLLDNILVTVIVPIIPEFIWYLEHGDLISKICRNVTHFLLTKNETFENKYFLTGEIPVFESDSSCKDYVTRHMNRTSISAETMKLGFIFSAKPVVQLLVNPFVGPLTNRIGYTIPMFTGFIILFISTLVFAYAGSYTLLFFARSFQGIGSALSTVTGMGMLATFFPEEGERGKAFGFALSGLALGVLIGPSFGGVMYEYVSKESPFLILSLFVFLDCLLLVLIMPPRYSPEPVEGSSLISLLRDPYIILAAGAITIGNFGIAVLEPSLPIFIKQTLNSSRLAQGLIFLPFSLSYLASTNIVGMYGHRVGRWLIAMIGMLMISLFLFIIPISTSIYQLIFPGILIGIGIGMVDCSILPIMGYLVDIRHTSVYGSVYAIADVAFCIGFAVGPSISGALMEAYGFQNMLYIASTIIILFVPFLYFLRNPPGVSHEPQELMKDSCPDQYKVNKSNGTTGDPDGPDAMTPLAIKSKDYGYGTD